MKPRLLINIITPSPVAYKSWLMHRSRWWMNEWTDSDTSVSGGTIYRHWRMCFERLLQAFARWQPGILLIVIHNRYSFAANNTLIHCLSSSDSTVHPEKSASWELPRNSFLTCFSRIVPFIAWRTNFSINGHKNYPPCVYIHLAANLVLKYLRIYKFNLTERVTIIRTYIILKGFHTIISIDCRIIYRPSDTQSTLNSH